MIDIDRATKSDRLTRAVIGMTKEQFEGLLVQFEQELVTLRNLDYQKRPRKRAPGAGRPAELATIKEKLFFILFYYKCYPTFDLAGLIFNLDRSNTKRWKDRLEIALERTLGAKQELPQRKISSIDEFLRIFPEVTGFMIDGTERRIQRPKDAQDQKKYYSGKKKYHTVKNQVVATPDKRVHILTATTEGKQHDYRQIKESDLPEHIPKDFLIMGDTAYIGGKADYPDKQWLTPLRKPRGKEFTETQKLQNRTISSLRIKVEHAIGGIKRYRIVSDRFRNRRNLLDEAMLVASGLWNYYLSTA